MKRVSGAALLFIIQACSFSPVQSPTFPPGDTESASSPFFDRGKMTVAVAARRASLQNIEQWDMVARMSIRRADDLWSGKLRWGQAVHNYTIQISDPFGQGAMRVHGDSVSVTMMLPGDRTFVDDDLETIISDQLGWQIPFNSLRYWVVGLPSPQDDYRAQFDEKNNISTLSQSAWVIEFNRYQRVNEYELPKKLRLHDGEYTIKLIIDRWKVT